jgi:leishmanolysin
MILVAGLTAGCDHDFSEPRDSLGESDGYAITLRYVEPVTSPRYQLAIDRAVRRWESILAGGLTDYIVSLPAGACLASQPALDERVDDILVLIEFGAGDGPGGLIGEGGPCSLREDNLLPALGYVKLDLSDLEQIDSQEMLDGLVLHEIGHVLGVGTLWRAKNLITDFDSHDPRVTGASSMEAYRTLGGEEGGVPAEASGTAFTRSVHWRESVFTNELMTGYLDHGANPLSELTIGTLRDLGYSVNSGAASEYTMTSGAKVGVRLNLQQGERIRVLLLPN